MTRTYAAKRLLEHGPLTLPEVVAITGWARSTVYRVISDMAAAGVLRRFNADGKAKVELA